MSQRFGSGFYFVSSVYKEKPDYLETPSVIFPGCVYQWTRSKKRDRKGIQKCLGCMVRGNTAGQPRPIIRFLEPSNSFLDDPDDPPLPHICKARDLKEAISKRLNVELRFECRDFIAKGLTEVEQFREQIIGKISCSQELDRLEANQRSSVVDEVLEKPRKNFRKFLLLICRSKVEMERKRAAKRSTSLPPPAKRSRLSSAALGLRQRLKKGREAIEECQQNDDASISLQDELEDESEFRKRDYFTVPHFGVPRFGEITTLETVSHEHPNSVYHWVRHGRIVQARQTLLCTRCRSVTKKLQLRTIRISAEGHLLDDPDHPSQPHICRPISTVDAIVERITWEMIWECRRRIEGEVEMDALNFYQSFLAELPNHEALQSLDENEAKRVFEKTAQTSLYHFEAALRGVSNRRREKKIVQPTVRAGLLRAIRTLRPLLRIASTIDHSAVQAETEFSTSDESGGALDFIFNSATANERDFGPCRFVIASKGIRRLETQCVQRRGFVYHWRGMDLPMANGQAKFHCVKCLKLRVENKIPISSMATILVFKGRVIQDPENPEFPHECEPILYVNALADQFRQRLLDAGRQLLRSVLVNENEREKLQELYDTYETVLLNAEELQELPKKQIDEVMKKSFLGFNSFYTICVNKLKKEVHPQTQSASSSEGVCPKRGVTKK